MTSPLRGSDVIDAEFEHIDEQGQSIPSPRPAKAHTDPSVQRKQVDFEDGKSAGYRRLSLFSGETVAVDRRHRSPVLGVAAVVTALVLGGAWFAADHLMVTAPKSPQTSTSLPLSNTVPNALATSDAIIVGSTTRDPAQSNIETPSIDKAQAGKRLEGSVLYVRTPKKQPTERTGRQNRNPVSPPVRGHKDLTISLAGGSGGR